MVVIVGAGVVGAATAYYLSTTGYGDSPITILDAAGPAAGASGRAGAFITNQPPLFCRGIGNAKDKRGSLFEKSFDLHLQLAKDLKLESFCSVTNYQGVRVGAFSSKEGNSDNSTGGASECDKFVIDGRSTDDKTSHISSLKKLVENDTGMQLPGDAALVDPAELVSCMMDKVLNQQNNSFHKGTVSGLELDSSGSCVTGVHIESGPLKTIPVSRDEPVVIALGPWTSRIEDWLQTPMPIEGVLSTSLIYNDGILESDIGSAFFFDEDSNGCHLEVFGRRDKSLYISGCGESQVMSTRLMRSNERPSPTIPCSPDFARASAAQASLQAAGYERPCVTGTPSTEQSVDTQACIRPMSPDGLPVVGKLLENVFVATGGGPWGITWGPLMGKSLASLIKEDEDTPIRLGPLSPRRFDTLVYKTLLKSRSPINT